MLIPFLKEIYISDNLCHHRECCAHACATYQGEKREGDEKLKIVFYLDSVDDISEKGVSIQILILIRLLLGIIFHMWNS